MAALIAYVARKTEHAKDLNQLKMTERFLYYANDICNGMKAKQLALILAFFAKIENTEKCLCSVRPIA